MPVMPRVPGKATKIAYMILGKPANIVFKPNNDQRAINERLLSEETKRVR
jgi:hypothetical protein